MNDGEVRFTTFRPSFNVHRSNFDVSLANLKMFKASLEMTGAIVVTGRILQGKEARRHIALLVHVAVNRFNKTPRSNRDRTISKERCAIAYQNKFAQSKQWSTLIRQAIKAYANVKHAAKQTMTQDDYEPTPRGKAKDPYETEFTRIIKRVGLRHFERILRDAKTNEPFIDNLISDAIIA